MSKFLSFVALSLLLSGCLRVVGATAIQPAITSDAPATWIYLQTNDRAVDGVYRCHEQGPEGPICKQARIVH